MYSSDLYQKALNRLDRRREEDELRTAATLAEVSAKVPRLEEIQNQLRQVGFSISKAFFAKDAKAEIDKLQAESLRLQGEKERLLVAAGYAPDALAHHYQCPTCKDTGYVGDRMCTCQRELLKDLQREAIRRLAPLDSCTFDSFDTNYYPETAEDNGISPRAKADKIAEACHRYAQRVSLREPANLMLMGQTGLGKTHLSLAIANVAIGRGLSVEYGTAYNILSDLQNENFGRTGNLQYTEERVLHTDLLILDDLGTEYTSAYTVACLYNIINTRILCSRPTVISTNLGLMSWRKIRPAHHLPHRRRLFPSGTGGQRYSVYQISANLRAPKGNKSKRIIYRTSYKKSTLKGCFFSCERRAAKSVTVWRGAVGVEYTQRSMRVPST